MTSILKHSRLYAGSDLVRDAYVGTNHVAHLWENLFTNPSFEDADLSMFSGGTVARSSDSVVSGEYSLDVSADTTYAVPSAGVMHTVSAVALAGGQSLGAEVSVDAGERLTVMVDTSVVFGVGLWDDVLVVEGTVDPGYFDGDTPPKVRRNLHPNPHAVNGSGGFGTWDGGGGGTVVQTYDNDAPWSVSGKSFRATWTVAPTNPYNGDIDILGMFPGLASGMIFTIAGTLYSPRDAGFSMVGAYNSGAAFTLIATSHPASFSLSAGETVRIWITLSIPVGTSVSSQVKLLVSPEAKVDGDYWELADPMVFLGEYDAGKDVFFSGSYSPDPSRLPAWEGTPNASPSYLYDYRFNNEPFWAGAPHASTSMWWGPPPEFFAAPPPPPPPPPPGDYEDVFVTDNGDGTYTISGPGVSDNGDGTYTVNGDNVVINPDGSVTITY